MPDSTDAELVGLTCRADPDAYKQLVARYQGHVYGLAYSLVGSWTEAQDIAQETFIRAYMNLDQLREPAKFAAWLRRVTFSVAMNWLKAFRPGLFERLDGQVDLDRLEIPDFQPGPPEVAERRELAEVVLAAIASLPPKYRVPLTMFHLDGLSYQKVSDFLDIPLGAVKGLIHRARVKLKAALAATVAEEVTPMVQEVFNEHKLPAEFATKVIDAVPTLAWGTGRECTFVGALEAAMAVTEHRYKHNDLMGFSGLAFRVRWWRYEGEPHWCHSCAVGEFPAEMDAIQNATGWRFHHEVHFGDLNLERFAPDIIESINAGKPVVGYDDRLDMAVAYGYQEGGKTLLWRDYYKGHEPHPLPAAKIGPLLSFLREFHQPPTAREALLESLRIAVRNWRRGHSDAGIPGRDYWYGQAALKAWADDLAAAHDFSDEHKKKLVDASRFNFVTLVDARKAAAAFCREHAELLEGEAREALGRAADLYKQEVAFFDSDQFTKNDCFVHPWREKGIDRWSVDVGAREQELLTGAAKFESDAIVEIEKALQALDAA